MANLIQVNGLIINIDTGITVAGHYLIGDPTEEHYQIGNQFHGYCTDDTFPLYERAYNRLLEMCEFTDSDTVADDSHEIIEVVLHQRSIQDQLDIYMRKLAGVNYKYLLLRKVSEWVLNATIHGVSRAGGEAQQVEKEAAIRELMSVINNTVDDDSESVQPLDTDDKSQPITILDVDIVSVLAYSKDHFVILDSDGNHIATHDHIQSAIDTAWELEKLESNKALRAESERLQAQIDNHNNNKAQS